MSAKSKVSLHIAAPIMDSAVAARCAQLPQQSLLNHFRWRFRPALILISAQLLRAVAVDDAILTVQVGSHQSTQEQRHGDGVSSFDGNRIGWNGKLVILARVGGAAAGEKSEQRDGRD